ncbi:AcrR Transcriptional regulator [Candidatus Nanopelagicaceae bacterium]
MPRINTSNLVEQREWRRSQLIGAAAAIALESGSEAITVSAVAQRAGLARTSVYEYFGSSAELVADLIIEELTGFTNILNAAIEPADTPEEAIAHWIKSALLYIADGRHLLAKALSATSLPINRSAEIGAAHRALLAPLTSALTQFGVKDLNYALSMIQSLTDAATKRIENGNDAEGEISKTTAFCIAGIKTLIES